MHKKIHTGEKEYKCTYFDKKKKKKKKKNAQMGNLIIHLKSHTGVK